MTVLRTARRVFGSLRPLGLLVALVTTVARADVAAASAIPSTHIAFRSTDVRLTQSAGRTDVAMVGLESMGGSDAPALPVSIRTFVVPAGMAVAEVRVIPRDEIKIAEGVRLSPREAALDPEQVTRSFPAGALEADAPSHPARPGISLGSGTAAGYTLHSVAVFPVRWDRNTGDLYLARNVDVELALQPAARATSDLVRLRRNPAAERAFAEALAADVENPEDLGPRDDESAANDGGFAPLDLPSVSGSPVDMVIVTTPALAATFQTLADWKTKKGIPTVVKTTDWINLNYPAGHDLPERTRDFLKDAYSKWGTYLLLVGGDFSKVPPREAFNRFFFQGGTFIPTDQYYACLEGDWNANGNGLYGEGQWQSTAGDSADIYPDIFVGRASVDTPTEASTFVTKSMTYDKTPPAGYAKKVCYLAEVLFPPDWEFGDPPENITLDGAALAEQFDALIPGGWTHTKRYQSTNSLDRTIALNELSSGHQHLVAVVSHGDAFKFSCGNGSNPLVYIADTDTLHNGNYLMFMMATACNPNQIDLECQGESFMNNPNGGAVAVVGPSREDFPVSAANFHLEMLRVCFTGKVTRFGAMSQVQRIPFAGLSQTDMTPDRWTMMTKMLLGDPELRLWTDEPATLTTSHPASLPFGTANVTVTVTKTAVPVPDALVCISDANGTYARARTNAAGQATLPIESSQTGTVNVVATAPECKPKESTFTLTAAAGAVVSLQSQTFDDDSTPPSSGNGNGILEAGETIGLGCTAKNGGTVTANGVSLTAAVQAGSNAVFDVFYDGVRDTSKVFIGPNRVHPATVPFTLDFGTPLIDYIGTPAMSFAADTSSGDHGVFVWQDDEGWHMRWASGADSTVVNGTVTTNGKIRGIETTELEAGPDTAVIGGGGTTLTFSGATHQADLFDELTFAMSDATKLSIVNGNASLGNIAAGATAVGTVTFAIASSARDGQVGYVDLTFTSTSLATWSAVVPVVFAGPSLEAVVFTVNDTTNPPISGDGDGIIEVGETVRLTPTVLNRGAGRADAVNGSATAGAGITFIDAADSYGGIAPLAQTTGTNGYVFTVNNGSGTSITLTLTDSQARTWVKPIDFLRPAVPTLVTYTSSPTEIELSWAQSTEPDLAGYRVYRGATAGTETLRSFELLRTGSVFVDAGLALGSSFYYQVTAVDSSGNESPRSPSLLANTTQPQVPGWPKQANSNIFSSITIGNADATGNNELYVGSQDFRLYGWQSDGATISGFPFNTQGQIWSTATLADLDKDGKQEILFGSNDVRFYVLKYDGTAFFTNPYLIVDAGSGIRSTPTVADVDGDSKLEIFVGTDLGRMYAFNNDGTGQTQVSGIFHETANGAGQTGNPSIWGPCAVADFDGNGTREIAFTCWNDSLFVCRANGTDYPGFPKKLPDDMRNGPVFADLDADGTKELIVCCNDNKVYAYNHDGSNYLPGGVLGTCPDDLRCQPTPCNLDGDPQLEIVVPCLDGHIYAFNHNGTGFLNANGRFATVDSTSAAGGFTASAIVVDVNGDSQMEIFVGHHNGKFYGFHANGTPVVGTPVPTPKEIFSTACAADLDGDGGVDVAFASYDQSVNVLDFAGPSTPAAYQWPMYGGNIYHTSSYGELQPYQTDVDLPTAAHFDFALPQNQPNPFGTGTTIRYSLPHESKVQLHVYNVEGRLVRTLVDGNVAAGAYAVTWDGRDAQGARLSSGVYFYRLVADGQGSLTRKALFLR